MLSFRKSKKSLICTLLFSKLNVNLSIFKRIVISLSIAKHLRWDELIFNLLIDQLCLLEAMSDVNGCILRIEVCFNMWSYWRESFIFLFKVKVLRKTISDKCTVILFSHLVFEENTLAANGWLG